MAKVFISHATDDRPLAEELFDLLQLGCDLSRDDIFCSSVEGANIRVGKDFVDWIEDKLSSAELILLVVTPNYLSSQFCLAEMGAAWALDKDVFPITLPEGARELGAVMLGRQTATLNGPGLDGLRDQIAEHHPSAGTATGRWSAKKESFLDGLDTTLDSLPEPETVTRGELEAERGKTEGMQQLYQEVQEKNRELRKYIDRLEKAKDAQEVAEARADLTPDRERYEELIEAVQDEFEDLTPVEVRCIFASTYGEAWTMDSDTRRWVGMQIERAKQSDWIKDVGRDGAEAFLANDTHPRLRNAFQRVDDLNAFLVSDISYEVSSLLEEEKKLILDVNNRQFWEEELTTRPMPG